MRPWRRRGDRAGERRALIILLALCGTCVCCRTDTRANGQAASASEAAFGHGKGKSPFTGHVYLYGESHGNEKIIEREFDIWNEHYKKGTRHLFVELPYFTGEYLNLWMKASDDKILEELYSDLEGTAAHNPYSLEFYRKIKSQCPETVFHGTDVGHQYGSTGYRYLEFLEAHNMKETNWYSLAKENISQGINYYNGEKDAYRENMVKKYDKYWGDDLTDHTLTTNLGTNQGDGIVMAQKLNASLFGMEVAQMMPSSSPTKGTMTDGIWGDASEQIWIDGKGNRFVNEYAERDVLAKASLKLDRGIFYIIYAGRGDPSKPENKLKGVDRKSVADMMSRMARLVSGVTSSGLESTRETVAFETPASLAMSAMVTCFMRLLQASRGPLREERALDRHADRVVQGQVELLHLVGLLLRHGEAHVGESGQGPAAEAGKPDDLEAQGAGGRGGIDHVLRIAGGRYGPEHVAGPAVPEHLLREYHSGIHVVGKGGYEGRVLREGDGRQGELQGLGHARPQLRVCGG